MHTLQKLLTITVTALALQGCMAAAYPLLMPAVAVGGGAAVGTMQGVAGRAQLERNAKEIRRQQCAATIDPVACVQEQETTIAMQKQRYEQIRAWESCTQSGGTPEACKSEVSRQP